MNINELGMLDNSDFIDQPSHESLGSGVFPNG